MTTAMDGNGDETEMGEPVRKTTISAALHQPICYVRMARWKPLLSEMYTITWLEFAKMYLKHSPAIGFYGLMELRLNSLPCCQILHLWKPGGAHHLASSVTKVKYVCSVWLGKASVIPDIFHLPMMKATVFFRTFKAAERSVPQHNPVPGVYGKLF